LRARDGLQLVCYLSRPRGWQRGKPVPMVLLVHGGPWARDVWALYPAHQWLADRGYAVLSVNYRGSTGFGKAFVNAANLEWAGRMHDDLIDAVDWAIGRGIADDKRIAIYGASYGGYSALVGATFTPEKFACAIDVFGISNLLTFLATVPDYWKPWQTLWKVRMGDYTSEAGRKLLEQPCRADRAPAADRPGRQRRAGEAVGIRADRQRHAGAQHPGDLRLLFGRGPRFPARGKPPLVQRRPRNVSRQASGRPGRAGGR
jgi:predicted acyl esterase